MDLIHYLRLSRKLSGLAVVLSFAYFTVGAFSLISGIYKWHMIFMGAGVISFAAGVNISFWASLARRYGSPIPMIFHSLFVISLPIAYLVSNSFGSLFIAIMSLSGILFLLQLRRGSISFLIEIYSFTALLISSLLSGSLIDRFLWMEWAYPVPLIYAVSAHALPRTYKYELNIPFMAAALLTHAAALLRIGPPIYLMWTSILLYVISLRLDLTFKAFRSVRVEEAIPAHRYMLSGYLLVFLLGLLFLLIPDDNLSLLHYLLLGFIGLHIYVHAPMMIPVLLGTSNSRRFTLAPLVLIFLAALSWPYSRTISLYFICGSLPLLFYIVKP